jgi:hypothetical protein
VEARFAGCTYQRTLDGDYRWSAWTGPGGMSRDFDALHAVWLFTC